MQHTAASSWPAYDVWINDTIPEGLTYVSNASVPGADGAVQDGQQLAWYYEELPEGDAVTINYTVTVDDDVVVGQDLDNAVDLTWTSMNGSDPDERFGNYTALDDYNRSAAAPLDVNNTAIVTKAPEEQRNYTVGETVNFTIQVDLPNATAYNVWINDTLPAGFIYYSSSFAMTANNDSFAEYVSSPNDGSAPVSVNWSLGTVNNTDDTDIFIAFNVTVADVMSNQNGTVLNNTAALAWTDDDGGLRTDVDTSGDVQLLEPDLSVGKSVNRSVVEAGDVVNYSITVQHTAASSWPAYDVWINDTIPEGLTYVSNASVPGADGAVQDGQQLAWYYEELPEGDAVTINYTVTVDDDVVVGQDLDNAVDLTWTSMNGSDPDERFGNRTTLDDYNSTATAPLVAHAPALSLVKQDSPDPVPAGNQLTYILWVNNTGNGNATAVNVTETFDSNVTFVSSVPAPTHGNNVWINNSIAPGESWPITITVNVSQAVPDGALVRNFVNVTCIQPAANQTWENTTVRTEADVEIRKADSDDPVVAGTYLNYTLTAVNHGPSNASQVVVNDTLPDGTTFNAASDGATLSDDVVEWTLPYLNATESRTFWINVTVNASVADGTVLNNTATVSAATDDPHMGNNTGYNETDVITEADLAITKGDSNDPVLPGNYLNYTLNVTNHGPSDARSLVICDTLPENVTFNHATPGCTGPNPIKWTIPRLNQSDTLFFWINVTVNTTDPFVSNTANVTSATPDSNLSNNEQTEVTATYRPVLLELSKTVWNGTAWTEYHHEDIGDVVRFNLSVHNNDTEDLVHINVTDHLPAALTYADNATVNGVPQEPSRWGNNNVSWDIAGPLSHCNWTYIEFDAAVTDSGVLTNRVNATGEGDVSGRVVSDTDTAAVEGEEAGVALEKTVWNGTAWTGYHHGDVGDTVTFNLTVTNDGTNPLVDVTVNDSLPAGMENATWGASHEWFHAGPVDVGASWSVTFDATVVAAGIQVNDAAVDAYCENTSTRVGDEDSATVEGENAEVMLEKRVWNGTAWVDRYQQDVGETITFNITVVNTGTNPLVDIEVSDVLPSTLSNESWSSEAAWTVPGPLQVGDSLNIIFNATVVQGGIDVNRATVTARCENTSHAVSGEDAVTVVAGRPSVYDPKVAEDVNGPPLEPGDMICYTAWINNTGTLASSDNPGNEFEDSIPDNTSYVPGSIEINGVPNDDDISDGVGYDAANDMVIWNGGIPAHGSIEISFCVKVDNVSSGTVISNQGTVYYDTDGDGDNDAAKPTDDPGTLSADDSTSLPVDYQPPWSWLTVTLDPDGYFVPASTFHIRADDDVGPWKIYYRIDNGTRREGSWNQEIQFQINALHGYAPGQHAVEYWAVDAAGNEELPHHEETYVLDASGPNTSISFDGIAEVTAGLRWQITSETAMVLSATDDHLGVEGIRYRVDDGDWRSYSEPFTVDEPGMHTIYYYAKDVMGNFGDMGSTVIDVGGGVPSSSCQIDPGEPTGDNGWYISGVTVTLSATDEVSGVNRIMYRVDGGVWQVYDGGFSVDSDGRHLIEYYAVDNAGNQEAVNTREIKIDLYGPEISISRPQGALYLFDRAVMPLPGNRTIIVGQVTVAATVVDTATSGVASAELYIDEELRGSFDRDIRYTLDETMLGRHTVRVAGYDNAGNRATRAITMGVFNIALTCADTTEIS